MKKKAFIHFIGLLVLLNIIPWALSYLDFSYYILKHPRTPHDLMQTAIESFLILTVTCFYAVFYWRKLREFDARWRFLNDALAGIPEAIFTVSSENMVMYMNDECSSLVGCNEKVRGKYSAREIFGKEIENILKETSSSKKRFTGMETSIQGPGGKKISCLITSTILRSSDSKQIGCIAILRDMREEKRIHAKFIDMERLASLGQLAASITHELNQPLNVIMMLCTSLLMKLESGKQDTGDIRDCLEKIQERVKRASNISDQVLSHAKISEKGVEKIDINSAIKNCLSLVEPQMRAENFDVVTGLKDNLLPVRIDVSKMEQVLFNIIQNARDAMNKRVEKDSSIEKVLEISSMEEGDSIVISFSDTGGGIPGDLREKIFVPFFTTKETGTGLGMGICREIVESFGGELDFEVKEGIGTTFRVKLPKV